MSTASEGVVEDDGVAWFHCNVIDGGADGQRHCTKMHRQVVALCDGLACGVVDGARVVEALLDVWRKAGAAESHSHLLGDGDEEIFEYFEFDWIETHCSPSISLLKVTGCLRVGDTTLLCLLRLPAARS